MSDAIRAAMDLFCLHMHGPISARREYEGHRKNDVHFVLQNSRSDPVTELMRVTRLSGYNTLCVSARTGDYCLQYIQC